MNLKHDDWTNDEVIKLLEGCRLSPIPNGGQESGDANLSLNLAICLFYDMKVKVRRMMEQEQSKIGPIPLPVVDEMEIIVKQRYGICAGCKWHPDVCEYCEQNYSEENRFGEGLI